MQTQSPPSPQPSPPGEGEEPYQPHLTAADLAKHEKRVDARREANANPLPGPLREAFAGGPVTVAGITFVPVTATHIVTLSRMDSPFLKVISGAQPVMSDEQIIEALFVLSRSARDGRALLARVGRAAFTEEALRAFDEVPLGCLKELGEAVGAQLLASFSTALKHGARPDATGEGGEQNFTSPQPAAPTTASAGGSSSSPSSPANTVGA